MWTFAAIWVTGGGSGLPHWPKVPGGALGEGVGVAAGVGVGAGVGFGVGVAPGIAGIGIVSRPWLGVVLVGCVGNSSVIV
jgi:hypothetical protein